MLSVSERRTVPWDAEKNALMRDAVYPAGDTRASVSFGSNHPSTLHTCSERRELGRGASRCTPQCLHARGSRVATHVPRHV